MRHLDGLTPLSRRALSSAFARAAETGEPAFAVDATTGNGHDTLFLAEGVGGNGRVWAFDVQEAALESAKNRFATERPELLGRVSFVLAGHETAWETLPEETAGHILAVTFNLGYLPGSDKRVTTQTRTTLEAIARLSGMLAVGGVICVHSYQGHEGGAEEGEAVARHCASLPWETWRVAEYAFVNRSRNRETLFLAERI